EDDQEHFEQLGGLELEEAEVEPEVDAGAAARVAAEAQGGGHQGDARDGERIFVAPEQVEVAHEGDGSPEGQHADSYPDDLLVGDAIEGRAASGEGRLQALDHD